ncbi:MAG: HD domain-containing phosphohydrolase [Thermoanaerobaculia bacterium]
MLQPSDPQAPRIFVVDDDEEIRRVLRQLLTPAGYAIEEFGTADAALEGIRQNPPDLVLLDLRLPDRSGHEVLEAIRADPGTRLLPVVMMTGYATTAERVRAQTEGVTDFIAKPFSPHELLPRVRVLVTLKQFADEHEHAERVILTLAKTIDARDPHTAGHSGRVADWADRIAERLGMDAAARNDMRRGALFHDIGRIVVPDTILRKPGVLTAEERQVIEEHPTVGYDLLEPMKTMRRALPIVHGHHERLDGSGYPQGISGPDIALPVRIVAVADVFDALVSDRAYRRAFSLSSALEVLSEGVRENWWDGDVVEALQGLVSAERQAARGAFP